MPQRPLFCIMHLNLLLLPSQVWIKSHQMLVAVCRQLSCTVTCARSRLRTLALYLRIFCDGYFPLLFTSVTSSISHTSSPSGTLPEILFAINSKTTSLIASNVTTVALLSLPWATCRRSAWMFPREQVLTLHLPWTIRSYFLNTVPRIRGRIRQLNCTDFPPYQHTSKY